HRQIDLLPRGDALRAQRIHQVTDFLVIRVLDVGAGRTVATFTTNVLELVVDRRCRGLEPAGVLETDCMTFDAFPVELAQRGMFRFGDKSFKGMRVLAFLPNLVRMFVAFGAAVGAYI